jgi:SynChlorMet cassette protein ScmC
MATEGLKSWLEELAFTMELGRCDGNGYPRLVFMRKKTEREMADAPIACLDQNMQDDLPKSGWKPRKLFAVHIWRHPDVPEVICDIGQEEGHETDIISRWSALYPIFERAQYSGGLPFHAALVERAGRGILLAAPGNTGKSTCCRRLPATWHALCDDETLVVRDHQERYLAHPFPTWSAHLWRRSEQTWHVERHVPLAAIFFLEQAEIDRAVPMGQGQAAVFMTQSAIQVYFLYRHDPDNEEALTFKKKIFENACEIAKSIPAFKLRVSPNSQFWEEIERVL